MRFVLNRGYDREKVVDADYFDYRCDGKFVVFWKDSPTRDLAVFTIRADWVLTIEAEQAGG